MYKCMLLLLHFNIINIYPMILLKISIFTGGVPLNLTITETNKHHEVSCLWGHVVFILLGLPGHTLTISLTPVHTADYFRVMSHGPLGIQNIPCLGKPGATSAEAPLKAPVLGGKRSPYTWVSRLKSVYICIYTHMIHTTCLFVPVTSCRTPKPSRSRHL